MSDRLCDLILQTWHSFGHMGTSMFLHKKSAKLRYTYKSQDAIEYTQEQLHFREPCSRVTGVCSESAREPVQALLQLADPASTRQPK